MKFYKILMIFRGLFPFRKRHFFLMLSVLVFILSSCVNTRDATYFNNQQKTEFISKYENEELILKENDILSIKVSSLNPDATEIFNRFNPSSIHGAGGSGANFPSSGYLINQDGLIHFPLLGKIKAAGKSKEELRNEITGELVSRKLLLEPIVDIRYLNFRISVLGEVARPSVLNILNEKVTLLEALSLAGDLTIDARRDNILLLREENGVKKLNRIDLTTDDLFSSPFYYLKPNDVLYVEPNKSKVATTSRVAQWLPAIISAMSLGVISIATFIN